jgi:hypothetical protein
VDGQSMDWANKANPIKTNPIEKNSFLMIFTFLVRNSIQPIKCSVLSNITWF